MTSIKELNDLKILLACNQNTCLKEMNPLSSRSLSFELIKIP